MALLTETTETAFTVKPNGCIEVQEAQIILRDGVEISRTYWREVLDPADTIGPTDSRGNARDPRVMDAVALYHTQAVKDARVALLASQVG